MITPKQIQTLKNKFENEGFDYALTDYSDWKQIKDDEFHKLRKDYINARIRLKEYLEDNGIQN